MENLMTKSVEHGLETVEPLIRAGPCSQPADYKGVTSQPANHLGPVFFTRKTYLFHRSGVESGGDLPKRTLSNVVFCNKYNEILLFWPCAGRAGPGCKWPWASP